MGVAISSWRLAQAVSRLGHLGVVAGHRARPGARPPARGRRPRRPLRRAFDAFPFRGMAERVWSRYYIPGGKAPDAPYTRLPFHGLDCPRPLAEDCLLGNFVEVFLAREGHANPVGINYLEKIQTPHLVSIYGAMLAGVDYILMGAGIPLKIPGVLDAYVNHEPATYPLYVSGARDGDDTTMHFSAARVHGMRPAAARAAPVPADHRVERPGGHAAEEGQRQGGRVHHRGPDGRRAQRAAARQARRSTIRASRSTASATGGSRKRCAHSACRSGWRAGSAAPMCCGRRSTKARLVCRWGRPSRYCEESGMRDDYKQAVLRPGRRRPGPGAAPIRWPRRPGFPFKVVQLDGTVVGCVGVRRPAAHLRSRLPAGGLPHARRPRSISDAPPSRSRSTSRRAGVKKTRRAGSASATRWSPRPAPADAAQGRLVEAGIITAGDDLSGSAASCATDRRATRRRTSST